MKWLLEHKFPYNKITFEYATKNGNLENIKWSFENKFPYDKKTFSSVTYYGKL
jgi:hypothetical protein